MQLTIPGTVPVLDEVKVGTSNSQPHTIHRQGGAVHTRSLTFGLDSRLILWDPLPKKLPTNGLGVRTAIKCDYYNLLPHQFNPDSLSQELHTQILLGCTSYQCQLLPCTSMLRRVSGAEDFVCSPVFKIVSCGWEMWFSGRILTQHI